MDAALVATVGTELQATTLLALYAAWRTRHFIDHELRPTERALAGWSKRFAWRRRMVAGARSKHSLGWMGLIRRVHCVLDGFEPIALGKQAQKDDPLQALATERRLSAWRLERNQRVYALAREWLLSWGMVQIGMALHLLDRDAREQASGAIGQRGQVEEQARALYDRSQALPMVH